MNEESERRKHEYTYICDMWERESRTIGQQKEKKIKSAMSLLNWVYQ